MSIHNILINEMSKSDGKVKFLHGGSMPNISPDIEFYKWLSYEFDEIKERKNYLNRILPENLTIEQLEELKRYREYKVYAEIFSKYAFGKKVTQQEYKIACDFMLKNNIFSIAKFKLGSEEVAKAKQQAKTLFSTMNENECSEYLKVRSTNSNTEAYLEMPLFDSLVFHLISDMSKNRGMKKLNEQIDAQIASNERMRERSYYNVSNPYRK